MRAFPALASSAVKDQLLCRARVTVHGYDLYYRDVMAGDGASGNSFRPRSVLGPGKAAGATRDCSDRRVVVSAFLGASWSLRQLCQRLASCPVGGLTLLVGIDRFTSEIRAVANLTRNIVTTLVVA
jgi:hypothetical protein